MEDDNYWNSSITITAGEKYDIDGLNIWEHKWIYTGDSFFKKEPVRQINYQIPVYKINFEGKTVRFGAMEVSNNAWLIYTHYK